MEENKDYRAYRYGDYLEPGAELKIEHSVSCEDTGNMLSHCGGGFPRLGIIAGLQHFVIAF